MNNTEKLKPCPFCGGNARLECTGGDDLDYLTRAEVTCDDCDAEIICFVPLSQTRSKEAGDKQIDRAITLWNTRSYEFEIAELTKELRGLKERMLAAEKYIHECPWDPDTTREQWEAYRAWMKTVSEQGGIDG